MVTASAHQIVFRSTVKEGDLIELVGRVAGVGRSSMRLDIEMHTEDLLTGNRNLCTTGVFVMVAVGDDGRRTPIER